MFKNNYLLLYDINKLKLILPILNHSQLMSTLCQWIISARVSFFLKKYAFIPDNDIEDCERALCNMDGIKSIVLNVFLTGLFSPFCSLWAYQVGKVS